MTTNCSTACVADAPAVAVLGSLNMDMVLRMPRFVDPGQTLKSKGLQYHGGGKGANQAVAAARLNARVWMIGRVGDDAFGHVLRDAMIGDRIDVSHVKITPHCSSGIAMIQVADSGQNSIALVGGANDQLTPADVDAAEPLIASARVLMLQLEVPMETVIHAACVARRHGVKVILDPAPMPIPPQMLPDELLSQIDLISPNQSEATAIAQSRRWPDDPASIAQSLLDMGITTVVLKQGAQGASYLTAEDRRLHHVPAFRIKPVDTTAAGDGFTAGLAVALARQLPLDQAVRWGCAVGGLAATQPGAQPSMPTLDQVQALLKGG